MQHTKIPRSNKPYLFKCRDEAINTEIRKRLNTLGKIMLNPVQMKCYDITDPKSYTHMYIYDEQDKDKMIAILKFRLIDN